jgi:hypothetical protein
VNERPLGRRGEHTYLSEVERWVRIETARSRDTAILNDCDPAVRLPGRDHVIPYFYVFSAAVVLKAEALVALVIPYTELVTEVPHTERPTGYVMLAWGIGGYWLRVNIHTSNQGSQLLRVLTDSVPLARHLDAFKGPREIEAP